MNNVNSVKIEPKFEDCAICVFYKYGNIHKNCKKCEIGENFEEKIQELDPDFELQMKNIKKRKK